MFNSNGSLSPSDIALLSGGNDFGFGGGGGILMWLLVILFAFGGFGGFGWGNNANTAGNIMDNYVLTSDFASLENRIDTVNANLCNGLYSIQGLTNGINQNVSETGFAIQNAITQDTIANMQNTFALGTQVNDLGYRMQNCCCENKALIADLKYSLATEACATRQAINDGTRAIIDKFTSERIQELEDQNQALRLRASQTEQNQYLLGQLKPVPIPAYTVANPYVYA